MLARLFCWASSKRRRIFVTLTIAAVLCPAFSTFWPAVCLAGADDAGKMTPSLPITPAQKSALSPPRARTPAVAPVLVPSVPSVPLRFQTDSAEVGRELSQLVTEALARNPDLVAARAGLAAAQARVPQAGMPKDPEVGFRMKDLPTTFSMVRENATEKQAVFRATYPFPGKLGLKQSIAGKEAMASGEDVRAAELRVVTQVRLAFTDIFVVDKNLQLALEQQRTLHDLADIATSKYRLGPGLQQDVLNADVALARIETTLTELSRRRQSRLITLATLLNRDQVTVAPLGVLPPAELQRTELELSEMIEATDPAIRKALRELERDQLRVSLARRSALPDFTLETEYGSREDHAPPAASTSLNRPDLMTGEILMSVPVFYWWKQREEIAEAEAQLDRSRARLASARRQALGSLQDLLARLRQHEQTAQAFQTQVIPLAQSQVTASISAYQVNAVDFLTLLDSQQKLEDYQTEYWLNRAERYRDLVQIDELSGAPLVESGWNQ